MKTNGTVYLIHDLTSKKYKIGCSRNPHQRLKQLQIGNPNTLCLVCWLVTDDMFFLERELHRRFEKSIWQNEWYILTSEEVYSIQCHPQSIMIKRLYALADQQNATAGE